MSDSIRQAISEFVRLNFAFDGREFDANTSFSESELIDSIGMLEVILFLEERFGITVEDGTVPAEEFDSVALLAAYVESRLARLPSRA